MAQYSPLKGETLYDVAANLYGDIVAGIQDLLTLNATINLDADDLYGSALTYTKDLKRVKPVFPVVPEPAGDSTYSTRSLQSIYDLVIQLYGDMSKIGNLIEYFPNLDRNVDVGQVIEVTEESDPIATFFRDRDIIVSTDIINRLPSRLTLDTSSITWDSTRYTFDET